MTNNHEPYQPPPRHDPFEVSHAVSPTGPYTNGLRSHISHQVGNVTSSTGERWTDGETGKVYKGSGFYPAAKATLRGIRNALTTKKQNAQAAEISSGNPYYPQPSASPDQTPDPMGNTYPQNYPLQSPAPTRDQYPLAPGGYSGVAPATTELPIGDPYGQRPPESQPIARYPNAQAHGPDPFGPENQQF